MRKVWSTWTSWECATSRVPPPPRLPIGSLKELNSARFNSHTPAWSQGIKMKHVEFFQEKSPTFAKAKRGKKTCSSFIHHCITMVDLYTSWWLNQPIWKILYSQIELFLQVSGWKSKNLWVATTQYSVISRTWTLDLRWKKKISIVGDQSSHTREEVWRCQRKWEIWKRSNRFEIENEKKIQQKQCLEFKVSTPEISGGYSSPTSFSNNSLFFFNKNESWRLGIPSPLPPAPVVNRRLTPLSWGSQAKP